MKISFYAYNLSISIFLNLIKLSGSYIIPFQTGLKNGMCSLSLQQHYGALKMSEENRSGNEERKTEGPLSDVELRRRQRLQKILAKKRSTKGDRMLDDFLGKRMGKGYVFYGEKTSTIDDETFNAMNEPAEAISLMESPLKPNSILVVGATGKTGQWVVLGLLDKGFNIRVFSRSLEKAERLFGPDGINSDIFLGDVKRLQDLEMAVDGAQAVIFVAGSREIFGGNSFEQVDCGGVKNLVAACKKFQSVKKIVLLSNIGAKDTSQSGILEQLTGSRLKWKAEAEQAVRKSGIEYVIVRADGLKDDDGGIQTITVGQGDFFGKSSISRIDLAEVLVQALVSDLTAATFEVKNDDLERKMRTSFLELDPEKAFQMEIEEEIESENYWLTKFNSIASDTDDSSREVIPNNSQNYL